MVACYIVTVICLTMIILCWISRNERGGSDEGKEKGRD